MDFLHKLASNQALLSVSGFALWNYISAYVIRQTVKHKYQYIGQVSDLFIYPLKGGAGNRIQNAKCTSLGLEAEGFKDRVFMAIRKTEDIGEFLDVLVQPRLVLITVKRVGDRICLDAPGMPTLSLPADLYENGEIISCKVNRSQDVQTVDCGVGAADWINKYLQKQDARLVHYKPNITQRNPYDIKRAFENNTTMEDKVAFAAVTPYMLANRKSLDDLNTRLEQPVTMETFRPNIVIDGAFAEAFEEDKWEYVRIGNDITMRVVEPRVICGVVNVDPKTAERNKSREPAKTLESYRMVPGYGPSACFGFRTGLDIGGNIKVGDPVYVIKN